MEPTLYAAQLRQPFVERLNEILTDGQLLYAPVVYAPDRRTEPNRTVHSRTMKQGNVAVLAGTVVTAAATGLGFVLPVIVPLLTGNPDDGSPFKTLRVTGGAIGGLVAGLLTPNRTGISKGVKAGTYGSLLLLVAFLLFNLSRSIALSTNPPFLSSIFLPFVLFVPIFGANVVGGLVSGFLGEKIRGELTTPAA